MKEAHRDHNSVQFFRRFKVNSSMFFRWPHAFLLHILLLPFVEGSKQGFFEELWGLGKRSSIRGGRRLLTRDLDMEEIFNYWQNLYGRWPSERYGQYLADYRTRVNDAGREWGIPKTDEAFLDIYYFLRNRTQVPHAPGWTPERDKCGPVCHQYGTCNQELGICGCPRGRDGPDCATPVETLCQKFCQHETECRRIIREWCINECNGRGTCVSGVCHCFPGYFGSDCSLSIDYDGNQGGRGPGATVLLAGLGYKENPRGPRIYIYEFPPQYHLWSLLWMDRPLNIILWERFMSLGLREVDPAKADYFFLPGCGRSCNMWPEKFAFIMEHYAEYWNRSHGRNHLVTHTGDWGRCEHQWGPTGGPFISNVTMLHHWGLTVDRSKEFQHDLFRVCHIPNQDILVPPMCGDLYGHFESNVWHPNRRHDPINKTMLASIAGSICGWNSVEEPPCSNGFYSLGVRAALWQLRDVPGFQIAKRVASMGQSMAESEFCFTPTGAGYGKRNVISTTLGCMPVVISDHVTQPYEPFLNWNEFGVWIPETQVADTEVILRGFTQAQKAEKMEKLFCAARHLAFTTVYGGLFEGDTGEFDAVATLVHILRARKRHPGVPDHKLTKVDAEFADFMACKHRDFSTLLVESTVAPPPPPPPPPAPPLPLAGITNKRGGTIDDEEFPERTVTTIEWVRAVHGDNVQARRSGGGWGPVDLSHSNLCFYNGIWMLYVDAKGSYPTETDIKTHMHPGQCQPKNAHRPGGFPPGASITCPPTGPITKCAQLV